MWGFSQADYNENYNTTGLNPYIDAYASTAWLLIDHFKDDIKLFELWNEPSCWAVDPNTNPLNPGCSYIWPRIFANLMAEVYKECIFQGGPTFFADNGVSLVSGAPFAHDIGSTNPASATAYIHDMFSQTDVWSAFAADPLNPTGRQYPWDFFGYHFYLNQGSAVSTSELNIYFNRNISGHDNDGIRTEQLAHGDTAPIIVTEFGWTTQGVGEDLKAANLTASFDWMRTQPYIAAAMWYQWNCCDPNGDWGLTQGIGVHEPAYFALAEQAGGSVPPSAQFSADPVSGIVPLAVQFTNETNGDVTGYNWNFGDQATSTAEHPQHTYNAPGIYTVSLTATGPGGSDIETKADYITVLAADADFTASPTAGVAPLTVQFADQSIGTVDSYDWDFGDGGSSALASPQHVYAAPGIYTVSLTVTSGGQQNTETKTDYIVVSLSDYDLDDDGDVDLKDFSEFAKCFTDAGPAAPPAGCAVAPVLVAPAVTTWNSAGSVPTLPIGISGSDLLEGRIGTIEAGGFHGATPGGNAGGLVDLTDGLEGRWRGGGTGGFSRRR